MNHKYNFITFSAALIFIACSMAGMSFILKIREKQLLGRSGEVAMDSPVLAWQRTSDNMEGEKEGENGILRPQLTMEQVEDVVISWNGRKNLFLHNPVVGQLTMEEAIQAGTDWLVEMGYSRKEQESEKPFRIKATLAIGVGESGVGTPLEAYYSMWSLWFLNETISVRLDLNAVTGKVWGAQIALAEGVFADDDGEADLERFIELAGLQPEANIVMADTRYNQITIPIEGNNLSAQRMQYQLVESDYFETGGRISEKNGTQYRYYQLFFSVKNLQQ